MIDQEQLSHLNNVYRDLAVSSAQEIDLITSLLQQLQKLLVKKQVSYLRQNSELFAIEAVTGRRQAALAAKQSMANETELSRSSSSHASPMKSEVIEVAPAVEMPQFQKDWNSMVPVFGAHGDIWSHSNAFPAHPDCTDRYVDPMLAWSFATMLPCDLRCAALIEVDTTPKIVRS